MFSSPLQTTQPRERQFIWEGEEGRRKGLRSLARNIVKNGCLSWAPFFLYLPPMKKCLSSFILSDQVRQLTPFLVLNCKSILRNSMFSPGLRLNHEMLTMASLLLVKRLFSSLQMIVKPTVIYITYLFTMCLCVVVLYLSFV